jgi:proline iminopeptidase
MKKPFVFLALMLMVTFVYGQKTDSIKYNHGYLYFHEYGAGEPIVILTGGPGANYQQLEEVGVNLSKTYRAILLEQRGTGRSMPKPFDASTINIDTAHDDLNRLLDYLKLKEAHLLGHSWGAMLAMSYAADFPQRVKSLILVDSGPFKLDPAWNEIYSHNKEVRLTPADKALRETVSKKMRTAAATKEDRLLNDKFELIPVLYDRTNVDSLITKINKGGLNPRMGSFMFQSLGKAGFDLSKKLIQFSKPIALIAGSQDPGAFINLSSINKWAKKVVNQKRYYYI